MFKPKTIHQLRYWFTRLCTGILRLVRSVTPVVRALVLVLALSASILYTRGGAPERAYAATASTLNFQARLLNSNGAIVPDGTYNVEFKLYDASTGGAAIWTETRTGGNRVTVKGGYLSVYLGDINALPVGGWDQERFLTLNIGGTGAVASWDGEMSPRLRLTAVPYAFQAQKAEGLEKLIGSFTGYLQFPGTLTQNTTYTLPDPGQANVSICLSSGNCAGQGGSVSGSGTQGRIAYFDTVAGSNVASGWLYQNSGTSTMELDSSRNLSLLGGNLSVTGNGNFTGNLTIGDSAVDTLTINGTAVQIPNGLNVDSNTFVIDAVNNRVGIGDATPAAALTVGNGDLFQVTSGGAIAAATGITSSGTITFSALGAGLVTADGSGVLSSGAVDRNSSTYFTGTMSVSNGGTGATTLTTNGILYGNGTGAVQVTGAAANSVLITSGTNVPTLSQTLPAAVQGNITSVGTLTSGSIGSGFGTISTGNNISTTAALQGGSLSITGNGTIGGTLAVQGATVNIGTSTQAGSLVLNDGSSNTATILSAALGQNTAYTLPETGNANAEFCVRYGAGQSNCSGLGNAVDSLNGLLGNLILAGTANEIQITDNGTDTITIGLPDDVVIASNLTVGDLATFNGGLNVTSGQFTNAGSTLFTAITITNKPTGGPIGTAAATVDVATTFNVNQTTTDQTLTLPAPTEATAGRIVYVNNIGTANFSMGGVLISAGRAQGFIWTGTAWTGAGIDSAGDGVTQLGTLDAQAKSANGAVITNNTLYLQTADDTFPGLVSTGAQTFAGAKTFNGQIIAAGGIDLGSQTLQGTTAVIDFTNFDVDASGNTSIAGTLTVTGAVTLDSLGTGLVTADANGLLTSGTVDRDSSTYFTGTLSVANGGTGATTLTANGILFGNGTGAIQATAAANDAVLVTDATGNPSLSNTLPTVVQGNITSVGTLTSGSIDSGFGTISTANNITTTATLSGGSLSVTNDATIGGDVTVSGGQITVGTAAGQAGSLVLYDGGSTGTENTLTINVANTLGQNTVITFPDPGAATAEVCYRNDSNCGFALADGGNYVQFTPSSAQVDNNAFASIFIDDTGGGNLLHLQSNATDMFVVGNDGSVTMAGDLAVNGGDITSATSLNVTAQNGALTLTSVGAGNNIILNAGGTIELQDNTNITGNLDVSGSFAVGTTDAFTISSSGAITAATGIVSSGTIQFSGLSTGVVTADGSGVIASGTLDRNSSTYFTGTLSIANGGTGATSFNTNGIVYYDGTTQVSTVAGADSVLITNGTNVPSLSQTLPLAVQSNITRTGALDSGSITSGFGSIDVGADAISTTGTITGGIVDATTGFRINGGAAAGNYLRGDGTNFVSSALMASDLSGTIFNSAADTGTGTFETGDTISIQGGTNGIDTSLTGDTYTINLDTTEIGTTTFGAGIGFTWTFDASALGVDPSFTFGDDALTVTAASTTLTGDLAVNGGDITSATSLNVTASNGALTLTSTGLGNDIVLNSADTIELQDNTNITGNLSVTGTGTFQTGNAAQDRLVISVAGVGLDQFTGTITNDDLTADRTFTLPDATGTFITTGNLTNITAVGTITAGTWNGSAIMDAYVDDAITISSAGSVDWTALTNYPTGCSSGQAITAVGDTLTCATFASADTDTTYTAGNDLDLTGTTFSIESQLDFVSVINQNAANLTLQTTTSGNIILNSAGTIELQGNTNVTGSLTVSNGLTVTAGGASITGDTTIATGAGNTLSLGNATGALTVTGSSASTFVINGVTITASEFNLLDGKDAALVDVNDAVNTAITGTGALDSGSITSGFGAIDTGADNIQTTGTVQGGIVNATTGFRINGGATTGNYLRGDGTNFISSQLLASDLSGTIFNTAADTGTGTYVTGDTISIQGGTNGIDTSLTGDTYTINLDTTEIGTTTFGAGSGFTWTFDTGVAIDPSISFADDALTVTAGSTTVTGDLAVNGGDITSTTSLNVTASNGALTLTSTGLGSDIVINSADTIELQDNTNVTGSLSISNGLTVSAGGASITGNTTIATTAGNTLSLGNATGALTVTGSSASTFVINGVTITAAEFNLLDGKDAALVDVNDAVNTAITGTGALDSGSITSGFGAIDTGADNIQTTGTIQGGIVNATTGFRINGGATAGEYLRGDGTNFVSSALQASDISGTIFNSAADTGTGTYVTGDTISIQGGTNGIDTTLSGDTFTVNLDTTEIGTTTFGSGSGFTWTFDSSALGVDPSFAFGDDALTITAATVTLSGDLRVNGNDLQDSTGTTRLTLGATNTLTGNVNATGNADFDGTLTVGTSGGFVVDANGAITAVTGITTTGGYTQSGAGANTFTGATGFTSTVNIATTSGTAFRVQNTSGADTLFTVDSSARGVSGGNLIKIGNSTGTDGDVTILQVDSTTADITSNLSALNGGIYYNSTSNTLKAIINGAVDELCLSSLGNCAGAGAGVTQSGTNASGQVAYFTSGNNITSSANFLFDGTNIDLGGSLTVGTADALTIEADGDVITAGDLAVNGGDITSTGALNITPGGALTVGAVGQTATLQGTITTITSNGAGNDIILSSADAIELQGATNVTGDFTVSGNTDIAGTLFVGTGDAFQVDASGNIVTAGDLAVNGGDITSTGALNITPGGALTVGATGQTALMQGSVVSITSNGAGNDITLTSADQIILNAAGTIELQDNTNVTGDFTVSGNADVAGYLYVGSSDQFQVDASGNTQTSGTLQVGGLATLNGGFVAGRTLGADSGTTQNVGSINFTTPADTTGTNTANGLNFTPTIGDATGGTNTANIINIADTTGDAQVSLNAINIGSLTGTAANEYVLNIGSGWDSVLRVGGTEVINGSGQVIASQISGDLFATSADSGTGAVARGDTLAIQGGTNGIDTSLSGDTYTFDLDYTEISTATFGSGSGFTWTYDVGAVDPQIGFASDEITLTVASTVLSGDLAVNGGDITSTGALNITPGGALTVGATGQNATLQGAVTTITSNGAGNDVTVTSADQIILNAVGTIELQDNTNVTGDLGVSGNLAVTGNGDFTGTLAVGTSDAFTIAANGDVATAGNIAINGGAVTSSAGTLTINAGGAIDLQDAVTADSLTLDSGALTFSNGVATDITTALNENLTVEAAGTGFIDLNDIVRIGSLGTADTNAVICRNAAGQLAACSDTFLTAGDLGDTFLQGGNSFNATAVLGTNDAFNLELETAGVTRLTIDQNGRVGIGTTAPSADLTFGSGATRTINVLTQATNIAGDGLTVKAGNAGTGASAFEGGILTLQGGDAAGTGNANGGAVIISGGAGVGTGTQGLVNLSTTAFTSAAVQTFASSGVFALTAGNVDNYSTLPVTASVTGVTVTVPDPVQAVVGRVLYIAVRSGSSDFTLRLNAARTPIDIAMKANNTATLIWNGTDWTAAGASSSTDLQSAYNNTLTSAGGAEIVLNPTGGTADGFTIRNNATSPILGGVLEVQSSIGTNLFSVNNFGTELAANGGSETAGSWAGDWTATGGSTVSRTTTSGEFVTGLAAAEVTTTAAVNDGIRNNLSGNPVAGTTYQVSFTAKLSAGSFSSLQVAYSRDGGTDLELCTNYSTQTLSTSVWTKITCTITTDGTAPTNPDLIIRQTDATARTFWIENLSFMRNDGTTQPSNVQVGGGINGGQVTLFTLDRSTAPPVANGDTTYLGSMYYDITTGRIQCYEADGWGACGSAPDNIITLTPEYAGAVLNGTGVGTMTADFCSNEASVLVVGTLCANHEVRNFYRWTSPQATSQTYSIYVSYKLPNTFKFFNDPNTMKLTALTSDTSLASASFQVFRKDVGGNVITSCGAATTINNTSNTWQQTSFSGDETACGFVGGDYVIFKIDVTARSSANVYVENLDFTYTNN